MSGLYVGVAQDALGIGVCCRNDAEEIEWNYLPGQQALGELQKNGNVRKIVLALERVPEVLDGVFPEMANVVQTAESWQDAAAQCAVFQIQEKGAAGGDILVLLLEERPAFAYYHLDAAGRLHKIAQEPADKDAGFAAWETAAGVEGAAEAWKEACSGASNAMRNYYRSKGRQDGAIFPELSCSQADGAFRSACAPVLEALLEQADAVMDERGLEDLPEIVLIGAFADFYPAEHLVRSHFCFDPFLAEPHFVPAPKERPHSYLIARGAALLASGKTGKGECWETETSLLLLKRQGGDITEEVVPLILAGQPLKDLAEPVNTVQVVYLDKREPISLLTNGEKMYIWPPEDLKWLGQLLEIGACVREGTLQVALRTGAAAKWTLLPAEAGRREL